MSSREGQVKNRAPAPIQISAEQIIREAADRQEPHILDPVSKIHDAEEYQSYLSSRRKHFEDNIRYRREHIGNWVKYARFEEENKEYERSRSVFERALEVEHRSGELWLRYAELEMRNEFVNRARNILDRGVQILPRIDFLWYKYAYMEEMVGDVDKCREVFERWMAWCPDEGAWLSYARFEVRCAKDDAANNNNNTKTPDMEKATEVMKRYVNEYPCAKSFLKLGKWSEHEAKDIHLARRVYESALMELEPEEARQARVFRQFAAFEERQGEYDRARVIYRHAIQMLHLEKNNQHPDTSTVPDVTMEEDITDNERTRRDELYKAYVSFEKKHGTKDGIENVILTKQRTNYNTKLQTNPHDYDAWFEYAKLEEDHGSPSSVRDVYERAVSNIPPNGNEKQYWKRYIYLWIYYALYEELVMKDLDRASDVYQTCIDDILPHSKFSFSKVWIYAAKLHVRRRDLNAARKLFGKAIGLCGKEKIFVEYIALELTLGEVDRCRALYNNYLKQMSYNCKAWSRYADLERSVGETDRCRALYELAVSQPALDMPELLWKGYIDFEIEEGEGDNARMLYERLLERTGHVKVWISYAQFEGTGIRIGGNGPEEARVIFNRAYDCLKEGREGMKEERVLLLDAWRVFEKSYGDGASVAAVEAKMPRRIKRKRMQTDEETGAELGWEEYFDYHFPDDQGAASNNLKILEMAAKWKNTALLEESDSDSDSDEDSD